MMILNDFEGSGPGLTEVPSNHITVGIERNMSD
jgi:hypothetical protein